VSKEFLKRPGSTPISYSSFPVMNRVVCLVAVIAAASLGPASGDVSGDAWMGEKPVVDAVVWLDAPDAPRPSMQPPIVLDQRSLAFTPRVLVVRKGSMVTFPNNDRVYHDVFADRDGQQISLGKFPTGTVQQIRFDRPGLSRVFCHIHPQMAAYILVVDSPYFAVSDASGRFAMTSVPLGEYRYHAWRPGGPTLENTLVVNAATRLEVRWP
jgi:plastocyanin